MSVVERGRTQLGSLLNQNWGVCEQPHCRPQTCKVAGPDFIPAESPEQWWKPCYAVLHLDRIGLNVFHILFSKESLWDRLTVK